MYLFLNHGFRGQMHQQAAKILQKFGGARRLAHLAALDPSRVYKWTYSKEKGGTGGVIPSSCVEKVQAAAVSAGISLTAEDWAP
jgi:hypothetical protein